MKRFDFHEQLHRGKIGESVIISLLQQEYIEYDVEDVSNVEEYKQVDIDVILRHKKTGEIITVEIKCDETTYKNWNIFAEITSCKRLDSPGWIKKTKADYICYAFVNRGCYLMIPLEAILDMIQIYKFDTRSAWDKHKESIGMLIPVKMLEAFLNKSESYKDKFTEAYANA